jgi:hypothetical protein
MNFSHERVMEAFASARIPKLRRLHMRGVVASLLPIRGKYTIFCVMKSLPAALGLAAARMGRGDEVIFDKVKNTTTSSTVIPARV